MRPLAPSRPPQPVVLLPDDARGAFRPGACLKAILLTLVAFAPGCARERRAASQPLALSVRAAADTGTMDRLEIRPPRPARAWLARVMPAPPGAIRAPLPDAAPDTVMPESPAAPVLEVVPGLLPPVLRGVASLALPAGLPGAHARGFVSVLLDVRVSETGEVTDVLAAGGDADSALAAAASACVQRMRFYPARRAGEPVAVWCRQRFDFGPSGTASP